MDGRDGMRQFLAYHRRMCVAMALACGVVLAGLLAAMRGDVSWALGFGIGAAAQMLKFGVIDVAVVKKLASGEKNAAAFQLKALGLSLAVLGLGVAAAVKLGGNVWSLAAGIFLPRMILVADTWIRPNPFAAEREAGIEETIRARQGD